MKEVQWFSDKLLSLELPNCWNRPVIQVVLVIMRKRLIGMCSVTPGGLTQPNFGPNQF